jgi:hypothetical protein
MDSIVELPALLLVVADEKIKRRQAEACPTVYWM